MPEKGESDSGNDSEDEQGVCVRLLPTNHRCLIPCKGKESQTSNTEEGANAVELLEIESRDGRADTVRNYDKRRNFQD